RLIAAQARACLCRSANPRPMEIPRGRHLCRPAGKDHPRRPNGVEHASADRSPSDLSSSCLEHPRFRRDRRDPGANPGARRPKPPRFLANTPCSSGVRHLRMVGLSLVAVLAIAAVTATSASALPEWGKCEVKAGGAYSDSNCTTKAKPKGSGGFEWIKGKNLANVKFKGESVGGGGVLTTGYVICKGGTYQNRRVTIKKGEEGGGENETAPFTFFVECASETNTGEASGTNLILGVLVTFKGFLLLGSAPCTSEGAEEGEVKVKPLKGKLGYINKSSKEDGVVLEPSKKHGVFAAFACSSVAISTTVGVGNSKEGTFYQNSPGVEKNGGEGQLNFPVPPLQ